MYKDILLYMYSLVKPSCTLGVKKLLLRVLRFALLPRGRGGKGPTPLDTGGAPSHHGGKGHIRRGKTAPPRPPDSPGQKGPPSVRVDGRSNG